MSAPILITVPRYVTIPRIKQEDNISICSDDPIDEFLVRSGSGKKRRLDHLSWEEKFQRK